MPALHMRQQIRAAVLARLANLHTTGQHAFDGLFFPLEETDLPCWLIAPRWRDVLKEYETSSFDGDGIGRIELRTLVLTLRGFVKVTSNPDPLYLDPALAALDLMCVEMRAAMLADPDLNALAMDVRVGDENGDFDSSGDKVAGVVDVQVEIDYRVRENAPNVGV